MFTKPYPPRWVNNIYFDTPDFSNYLDNVDGAVDRQKVRLRWYHGLFDESSNAALEIKIKKGLVGRKVQYPLGTFQFKHQISHNALQSFFKSCKLESRVKFLIRDLVPVLINRYWRYYFETVDRKFRVTVDLEMVFYHLQTVHNTLRYHHHERRFKVVELKYQKENDLLAGRIASHFPFSVYKNSKYTLGLESVYW
jgi:SPX domain protein involved in polyphosphate accumulation